MPNTYLIHWNFGCGDSGHLSVGSTEELLDFFDMRLYEPGGDHYRSMEGLDSYEVYALAGSSNPHNDIYEIFRIANDRDLGTAPEAAFPNLKDVGVWEAHISIEVVDGKAFGSSPEHALSLLAERLREYGMANAEPHDGMHLEIDRLRSRMFVYPVLLGSGFVVGEASYELAQEPTYRGDDARFDDLFGNDVAPQP